MIQALDYTDRIPGSILRANGYQHVFRYLGDPSVWPKAMTVDEVADLRNHGISIHLNYEQAADFMLGGYSDGQSFAREARKWATHLGFSTSDLIIYSADFDVGNAQLNQVLEFLRGAADADGGKANVGVYGGSLVVTAAINAGYTGWQAAGWAYGRTESKAIAWQGGYVYVGGVQCDINRMNDYYLQGATTVSGAIPQSIRDKWPAIAGQFTGNYDDSTAILWADAGARYAAQRADDIMDKLKTIQPISGTTLTANDIDAIATAVAKKLSRDLAAG